MKRHETPRRFDKKYLVDKRLRGGSTKPLPVLT